MPSPPDELTRLLNAASSGDDEAHDDLLRQIYDQLQALARGRMAGERPDHTLQPTALVHEAYMRLFGTEEVRWDSRGHFFSAAANAMRRILIEQARRKGRVKRGGGRRRLALDEVAPMAPASVEAYEQLLDLDEALKRLEAADPRKGKVVVLRYFAGLSVGETAAILDVSRRTVEAEWQRAKAWLYDAIGGSCDRDGIREHR